MPWLASRAALMIYDDELVFTLAERNVRLAREAGALAALPIALLFLSNMSVLAGQQARAADLILVTDLHPDHLDQAANILMEEYGLSCVEAGDLLNVTAC